MSEQVNAFFVTDVRDFAPHEAKLPDREQLVKAKLWTDLLITYTENELTYASKVEPNLVYRVPLRTQGDQAEGRHRNARVIKRLSILVTWCCVHRVEWRFLSQPRIEIGVDVARLLAFLGAGKVIQVESLHLDITGQAGQQLGIAMEIILGSLGQIDHMQLTLRRGDFSNNGSALQIVKSLDILSETRLKFFKLHVEISEFGIAGRRELERVSSVIASTTINRLTSKRVCDHLIRFIQHTRKDLKIYINSIEIRGETAIHIPRGNLSLSIRSISSKSRVLLSCDEQLAYLTVSESAAKRLSDSELDVGELQVMGKPSAIVVERIKAQFANVHAVR
ncbi:hypothetical protein TRVA0_009S01002 [Trichomonascus vanleenenianus]|uniref:uncharacterized protein n=1 Tax=Trichomonascus vanleenenianus TaxID=2268995 RepID=UPI003EC9C332